MYVYKITNKINNKNYIGITNNYKKRWSNEKFLPKDPKRQQLIQKKIYQYGKENFDFEVLFSNLSIEEACQKEQELIIKYNSLVPNGYNINKGGKLSVNIHPVYGEKNNKACLTEAEAQYIKDNRDRPMYELYEEFNEKISYITFKKCYKHQTYTHLPISKPEYPYNAEFSGQFSGGNLEYDEVIDCRQRYANGEYWENVYKDYQTKYKNKWSFWNLYNGKSYIYVMPEVFSEENRAKHRSLKNTGSNNGRSKLSVDDVKKIRQLHDNGISNKEIYNLYPQVSPTSIRDIINFKTWKTLL